MKKTMWALLIAASPTAWAQLITVSTFDDIQYWTGSGTNRAALVMNFGAGDTPTSVAWGYRWNGATDTAATMLFALAGTITGSNPPTPLAGADARLAADVITFGTVTGYYVSSITYNQVGLPSPWTQASRGILDDYGDSGTYPAFYSLNGTGGVWTGASFVLSDAGISDTILANGMWAAFAQTDGTDPSVTLVQPAAAVPEPRTVSLLLFAAGAVAFGLRKLSVP